MMLKVRVKPSARENRLIDLGGGAFRISVTAAPEDGKANQKVCEMLAKHLGIRKSNVTIARGKAARDKWVEIGEA